ncbi:hypothetical protein EKD04_025605 [Chloroflexales bacterium ZM16-3]|nr:hypothetical protein [Chloroflexales bacterium ZM16-3]
MDIVLAGIGAVAGGIGVALIIISERQLRRQAERDVRRALFPIWERLRQRSTDAYE